MYTTLQRRDPLSELVSQRKVTRFPSAWVGISPRTSASGLPLLTSPPERACVHVSLPRKRTGQPRCSVPCPADAPNDNICSLMWMLVPNLQAMA